ncbi:MAG: cytochrome-c peroxidase, partial [Rhizobiaceae bacterium]
AYPELQPVEQISMVNIANAISAFVAHEWRSDNSAFDAYLKGDRTAISMQQQRGMELFYGKANCFSCHSGSFQTDHEFHAVAMPLWRFDADISSADKDLFRDRSAQTGQKSDRHKRRTPSLRNVEHTAPYGHAGSFETLEGVVKAHLDPVKALRTFVSDRISASEKPAGLGKLVDSIIRSTEIDPIELSDTEVDDIVAFLTSLSEPAILAGRLGRPDEVPSFLALD